MKLHFKRAGNALYNHKFVLYPLDMDLVVDNAPAKVLRRIQSKLAAAIMKRMKAIAIDPFAHHPNVETLQGTRNGFRLRQGDWRVIYEIDTEAQVVRVTKLGPRGQVYR